MHNSAAYLRLLQLARARTGVRSSFAELHSIASGSGGNQRLCMRSSSWLEAERRRSMSTSSSGGPLVALSTGERCARQDMLVATTQTGS